VLNLDHAEPVPPAFAELVAERFGALAEPMRIRLLDALRTREEASVQELADALDAGHANVSKHLGVLHAQRVVARRKEGTRVLYRILDPSVFAVCDQICGAIHDQLEELIALVGEERP
jgi:DNA-binding transcriptional ArsR family regulator